MGRSLNQESLWGLVGCERCAGTWMVLLTSCLAVSPAWPRSRAAALAPVAPWAPCMLWTAQLPCTRTWIQLQPSCGHCGGSVPDHSLRAWPGSFPLPRGCPWGGPAKLSCPERVGDEEGTVFS